MLPALNESERWARAFAVYRAALAAPFYAAKYAALAAPVDGPGWQQLPILTHQELYDNTYPRSEAMLTRPVQGMLVSSTGGSTGLARYTVFTWEEWDTFVDMQARATALMGVTARDRVANLFIAGHLWPSFLGLHDVLRKLDAVHLPISGNIPMEDVARLCAEFDPTVLVSLPTAFVLLGDVAAKAGYRFPSLRLLGYVGEQMSDQAHEYARRALGVEQIVPFAYTSADAGLMGYPCAHCGFGEYHLPSAFQFIEIRNPDSHAPTAPGEIGELIVTNLARLSMPIVRYQIGDVGAWIGGSCPCGDPNPRFRLAGRAGEDFKIGGGLISMAAFDQALAPFADYVSPNWTVQLEDVANQMDVRLLVEAPDPSRATEVTAQIRQGLCDRIPELPKGLEMRFIRTVEVRPVPLGTLPRSPITGKVRRLDDRRVAPANPGA